MFRIVIPGTWCAVVIAALMRLNSIEFLSEHFWGLKGASVVTGFGVGFGLLFHYVVNYPRLRHRFRKIEKEYGPIDFLLEMCRQCQKPCKIDKSYKGVSYAYFSILNDDMPPGTRTIVYYFSSVYLMLAHIAFISVVLAVANSLLFLSRRLSGAQDLLIVNGCVTAFLVGAALMLTKRGAAPEKYLIRMFEMQTNWLKLNQELVKRKLCTTHRHKVQMC